MNDFLILEWIKNSREQWLEFYHHKASTSVGHTLQQILAFTDEQMEAEHGFIQWLFPNWEPSEFNPTAPLLSMKLINEAKSSPIVMRQIENSLVFVLNYWGIKANFNADTETGVPIFTKAKNFEDNSKLWVTKANHNQLRISRVLIFMNSFGMKNEAIDLSDFLVNEMRSANIDSRSIEFWQNAHQKGDAITQELIRLSTLMENIAISKGVNCSTLNIC